VSSPQDEAIDILEEVLDNFFRQAVDLKNVLRRCVHVCEILNWSEQLTWFQNELFGYPSDVELPWYRKAIKGRMEWRATGGFDTVLAQVIEDRRRLRGEPIKYTKMDVRAGIDWVLSVSQWGYSESTGRKSLQYISFRHENIETEKVKVYDKQIFQTILTNIENLVFNFVSTSLVAVKFGQVTANVFRKYQDSASATLGRLGVEDHLKAAYQNLLQNNEASWQAAVEACRNIMYKLSETLWQSPDTHHPYLKAKNRSAMRVTRNEPRNRIRAYLQEKGVKEDGMLRRMIDPLYSMASAGKRTVSYEHAQSVLILTYIFVAEMIRLTDMIPVVKVREV
jgi:hypothetical protein